MPTFTITLREVLELTGASTEYVDGRTIVENSGIGLEYYPIFNEEHRGVLNSHIVDRYWNDEIAHETIAMFRQRLSAHMQLHMPTFNQRYKLALKDFDPLVTMQVLNTNEANSTQTGESESNSTGEANSKNGARNVYSDTPGTALAGNADYATNATDVTNYGESDSTSSDTGTTSAEMASTSSSSTSGYNGAPADILRRAQEAILNIDLLVVDSLQPLFMGLWGNSDEYPVRTF